MGLLTPKGKKGDNKKQNGPKSGQQSKFIQSPTNTKGQANMGKKGMTGGSQRGS